MKALLTGLVGLAVTSTAAMAASGQTTINGSGTYTDGRVFTVSARISPTGEVSGQATLINRNFTGDNGHSPYISHIAITCAFKAEDGVFYFGGFPTHTNDSVLDDAAFFAVRDGAITPVAFWDDIPGRTGDPSTCSGFLPDENASGFQELTKGDFRIKE